MPRMSRKVFEGCIEMHRYLLARGGLPSTALRSWFDLSEKICEYRLKLMKTLGWVALVGRGPGASWIALEVANYEATLEAGGRIRLQGLPVDQLQQNVLRLLQGWPAGRTTRDLAAAMSVSTALLLPVLAGLVRQGKVGSRVLQDATGRPSARWWPTSVAVEEQA